VEIYSLVFLWSNFFVQGGDSSKSPYFTSDRRPQRIRSVLHMHLKPDLINPISNLGLGFLSPEKKQKKALFGPHEESPSSTRTH
jgi:hypothetical protein